MYRYKKYGFIVILFMLTAYLLNAQAYYDCKKIVWDYYRKGYAGIKKPEGNKVYYYNVQYETVVEENGVENQTSVNVRIYLSADQLHYITKDISVYQDEEDAFMLAKKLNILIHGVPEKTEEREEILGALQVFSDSVFATSEVTECMKAINDNQDELLLVTLETGEKASEALGVEKIIYQVNLSKDRIEKITMYYLRGSEYKRTVLTHLETDLNYKRNMKTPVKYLFFDTSGHLLPKYSTYRYIDNE